MIPIIRQPAAGIEPPPVQLATPVWAVAQLGERLVRNEEVVGSIPISSTNTCQNWSRRKALSCVWGRLTATRAIGHAKQSTRLID